MSGRNGPGHTGVGARLKAICLCLLPLISQRLATSAVAATVAEQALAIIAVVPEQPATCQVRTTGADLLGSLVIAVRCTGPAPYLVSLAVAATLARSTLSAPTGETPTLPQASPIETHIDAIDCLTETIECTVFRATVKSSESPTIILTVVY